MNCEEKAEIIGCTGNYDGKEIIINKKADKITAKLKNWCKIRPQDVEWMHDHNINFCGIEHIQLQKLNSKFFGNLDLGMHYYGLSDCGNNARRMILINNHPEIPADKLDQFIAHEIAHCKEDLNKFNKGHSIVASDSAEIRAEKFVSRIKRIGII